MVVLGVRAAVILFFSGLEVLLVEIDHPRD